MLYLYNGPVAYVILSLNMDWLIRLFPEEIREMCSGEHFSRFAPESERRKVGFRALPICLLKVNQQIPHKKRVYKGHMAIVEVTDTCASWKLNIENGEKKQVFLAQDCCNRKFINQDSQQLGYNTETVQNIMLVPAQYTIALQFVTWRTWLAKSFMKTIKRDRINIMPKPDHQAVY